MGDPTIRTWREGDDELLVPLWQPMGWTDPAMYGRKFEDPGNSPDRVFVAELDGRVVGHAIATRREVLVEGEFRLFGGVGHLAVHPIAKGRGLGRRLLEECHRVAREADARGVIMWTKCTFHPAFDMYIRSGYRLVAHEARHQVDIEWLREVWGEPSVEIRPLPDGEAPAAEELRRRWAEICFPVSCGWDVGFPEKASLGIYDGSVLVGTCSEAPLTPIVPRDLIRDALLAMGIRRLAGGERCLTYSLASGSTGDRILSGVSSAREEVGYCTLVLPLGGDLDLGDQEPVQFACWPW